MSVVRTFIFLLSIAFVALTLSAQWGLLD